MASARKVRRKVDSFEPGRGRGDGNLAPLDLSLNCPTIFSIGGAALERKFARSRAMKVQSLSKCGEIPGGVIADVGLQGRERLKRKRTFCIQTRRTASQRIEREIGPRKMKLGREGGGGKRPPGTLRRQLG